VSRFAELPILQRSVIILKDVLDESLTEIAGPLDITVDAVKGHLARGRARLREINAQANALPDVLTASAAVARYVTLFNERDWNGLRAPLADDVKLHQSLHPLMPSLLAWRRRARWRDGWRRSDHRHAARTPRVRRVHMPASYQHP
jgi:hypothetical protein